MKLWHITRTDKVTWEETSAIVVRATDEDAARAEALALDPEVSAPDEDEPYRLHVGFRPDNIIITELTPDGDPGVIIVSFLHG